MKSLAPGRSRSKLLAFCCHGFQEDRKLHGLVCGFSVPLFRVLRSKLRSVLKMKDLQRLSLLPVINWGPHSRLINS